MIVTINNRYDLKKGNIAIMGKFKVPTIGSARVTRKVVVPHSFPFQQRLGVADRTPRTVNFVCGELLSDGSVPVTRVINMKELTFRFYGRAFSSALAYFSSEAMARLVADSRVHFGSQAALNGLIDVQINGRPFRAAFLAGRVSWAHWLCTPAGKHVAALVQPFARTREEAETEWKAFNSTARPLKSAWSWARQLIIDIDKPYTHQISSKFIAGLSFIKELKMSAPNDVTAMLHTIAGLTGNIRFVLEMAKEYMPSQKSRDLLLEMLSHMKYLHESVIGKSYEGEEYKALGGRGQEFMDVVDNILKAYYKLKKQVELEPDI